MPELEELAGLEPVARAKRIIELLTHHQDTVAELSRLRRDAINQLINQGMTHREVGELLGIARARVGQILKEGPQPERVLFGTGPLIIAVGSKPEAQPSRATPSDMITTEMSKAASIVADTARVYGLDSTLEVVPQPGIVDMNRPNLVVIGSPKVLPVVSQALAADNHLGFACCARGWYLTEGDQKYRSPSDSGKDADYAYIGRLPRPDTKGTFLYLAGIHRMGTVGAAKFLADNLPDLYAEVRNRRWSVLIECWYDPDTREIQGTRPITPLYL